jgi:IS30 family transposase
MMFATKHSSTRSNAVMSKSVTNQEKCYTHLTLAEREEIAVGLEREESMRSIAKALGRNPSSISREIGRNSPSLRTVRYRGNRAQKRAEERSGCSRAKKHLPDPIVQIYVEIHLASDGWTPEQIAGRLPIDFPGLRTNYESIYLWIYRERRDLIKYLARGHKKRHKRHSGKKSRVSGIPNRVDINERPNRIELRNQAGHWEVDTVVSRQSRVCVAVLVERKSRFYLVIRIKDKTALSMHNALTEALSDFPCGLRRTLTYDNGLENALHEITNIELGTKSYFCKPYHSWEKGSIENRNGILRRYFPKKYNWRLTTQKYIDRVMNEINSTPMKCLAYKTPFEVFADCGGVALAS